MATIPKVVLVRSVSKAPSESEEEVSGNRRHLAAPFTLVHHHIAEIS
jgi:hypothetical protein